eukprot:GEMP01012801.1.p1 GENE.GEMP01012801.1~~GEMP01012801.1.p1  ORF type:complete len:596 (+),score=169.41 GEMP01012801.1:36-1790(+)
MSKKGEDVSASVEESNKLRKELGLKPLREGKNEKAAAKGSSKAPLDYLDIKDKEDRKKKKEKDDRKRRYREESNLEQPKEDVYKSGPKISEAVDGEPDDASEWVAQHRMKKQRTDRERRRRESSTAHTGDDLAGIHIAHDLDKFEEGVDATLVLADTPLLTESGELNVEKGELENVAWKEKSTNRRNNEVRGQKAGYDPTAEEFSIGAGGMPQRTILSKYDETPVSQEKGFTLGAPEQQDGVDADKAVENKLAELTRLAQKQDLNIGLKFQRDYYTTEEAGFKKFKTKKIKKRKPVKLLKDEEEEKMPLKMLERPEGCDSDEEDPELYESLRKQRAARNNGPARASNDKSTKEVLNMVKEIVQDETIKEETGVTITGTTQFCKSVETAVEKVESLKSETFQGANMYKAQQQAKRKQMRGVKVSKQDKQEKDKDKDDKTAEVKAAIAEESDDEDAGMAEAPLDMSIGSALEYLRSRDQLANDQDTCRKRNKEHRPLETSTDDGDIKLEYRDKFGRVQNAKEAFRTISWKFHGKMPGHKNYERRLQRYEREMMLRKKADKELPTQRALTAVQRTEHKPHMMLGAEK